VTQLALCDTNVLVSAFIAGGPPSRVIEAVIDGRIELVLAAPVIDELERVLTLKLSFEPQRLRDIVTLLTDISVARVDAPTTQPVEAVTGDPDDDVVLACGVSAGVQIIVSGDRRHMLPIREHRGIRIVSPQALLAELAGEQ
jgi:putative PIN family toxin of toxin-antitoxin system